MNDPRPLTLKSSSLSEIGTRWWTPVSFAERPRDAVILGALMMVCCITLRLHWLHADRLHAVRLVQIKRGRRLTRHEHGLQR